MDDHATISCPACGHEFEPADTALQQCPACGEQFFRAEDEHLSLEDEEARQSLEERLVAEQEKLSDRKIRDIKLQKQTLYRARSWMLVIGLLMIGGAGQLVWIGIRDAASHTHSRTLTYFVLAAALVGFSIRFFLRARAYAREADAIHLPEPTTAPDFTDLGDGSQFAKNLERMGDKQTGDEGRGLSS